MQKIGKNWVVADIHGCFKTFLYLVEDKIQLGLQDRLILLGDYIDRGDHSKQVIDYILELRNQGYQIVTLKGNHEDVLLRSHYQRLDPNPMLGFYALKDSWFYFGGRNTLKSFQIKDPRDLPMTYVDFLESLTYYHSTEHFVLTHAGLNFHLDDPYSDVLSMMWIKNFTPDFAKIGHRRLIHGHTPKTLREIGHQLEAQEGVVCLDNGCVYAHENGLGNLLAFELQSEKLIIQPNIEHQSKAVLVKTIDW